MGTKRTKSSFRTMSTNRKLESVFLFVTGRCNAKCKMCFYAEDMDKKENSLDNAMPLKARGRTKRVCCGEKAKAPNENSLIF